MAKKKTKKRKKKNRKKKETFKIKSIFLSFILVILVLLSSYIIFKTNILEPRIDSTTANYISFNNRKTTDMLEIDNIKKMSDKKGKSINNESKLNLKITGENNSEYEIIIYPLSNNIDYKYINYSLVNKNELVFNNLEDIEDNKDGGKILYKGKINDYNIVIRMWVSKKYKGKVGDNAFEVKVKEITKD